MSLWLKLVLIFSLFPVIASAHGLVTTQMKTVNGMTVEFEYNTLGSIFAGDYTLYNARLLDAKVAPAEFDSVFMRIGKQDGGIIVSANVDSTKDNPGYASLGLAINNAGTYSSRFIFYKAGKELLTADFDFEVKQNIIDTPPSSKKNQLILEAIMFLAGLIVGVGAVWWLRKI
jgi:hypothetical protein